MTDAAELRQDTDWHLDRLYEFAGELDATVLQARISRYAVDLNRPPNDASLYPGQITTGLCPTETFHGEPLYRPGCERDRGRARTPTPPHTGSRTTRCCGPSWTGCARSTAQCCCGTRTRSPAGCRACSTAAFRISTSAPTTGAPAHHRWWTASSPLPASHPFGQVLNGRFKGGYITRHYGAPVHGIHALQLEMCQCLYMSETAPFDYSPEIAAPVQGALRGMMTAALAHLPRLG